MNMAPLVLLTIMLMSSSICALHIGTIPSSNTDQGSGNGDLQASLSVPRAPRKLKATQSMYAGEKNTNEEEESISSEFIGMDYYQPKKRRSAHNDYPRPTAP